MCKGNYTTYIKLQFLVNTFIYKNYKRKRLVNYHICKICKYSEVLCIYYHIYYFKIFKSHYYSSLCSEFRSLVKSRRIYNPS